MMKQAEGPEDIARVRQLFEEYAASLGFDLCFQSFDKELAGLPGDYAPPDGRLFLAIHDEQPAGCVALHRFVDAKSAERICEIKRLYVRPAFRGRGVGKELIERVITEAREMGYTRMRLDTVTGVMNKAIAMYREYGFVEIESYRVNPQPGVVYMEKRL